MKKSYGLMLLFLLQMSMLSLATAQAKSPQMLPAYQQDIRVLRMNDPRQPFDMAAKMQWNPHDQRWDKVLVIYNGAAEPIAEHPVWDYLQGLVDPKRQPKTKGENLYYKSFRLKAMCDGKSPLAGGKAMRIDFNQNQRGEYNEEDFLRDWNCPDWAIGREGTRIVNGAESRDGRQALRLSLPKYRAGCSKNAPGCYNWKPSLGEGFDSIFFSYWVKFPENFDFVYGGKLPGVGSAEAGTGGNKANGKNGWSVRTMWEGHGQLGQYVYHIGQADYFGDFFAWDTPPIEKGKWYHIKTFVRLNTVGKRDGIIRTWLDGKQVLYKNDLSFRYVPDLKIERFLFSAFFGGTGAKWAPKQDMILYLDDFTISASNI